MLIIYVVAILLVTATLLYLDKRIDYKEIPIFKWTKENGEFYFSVPYYIWQNNKVKKSKSLYSQNTILDFDGYKYQITNYGGVFPKTNGGMFIERELRFWGEPLNIIETNSNIYITINKYGSGDISVKLNSNEYINEFINVQEYISKDININEFDKAIMEDFINKVLYQKSISLNETNKAYDTFIKYEPLLSFALNIISVIKDFII